MLKHILKFALGVVLVIAGIIGGLIPVFQGWIFGIPGLIILSEYIPPLKKLVDWAKNKYKTKNV